MNVLERVSRATDGDTVVVAEGEFRIDTARAGTERIWIVTRRSVDELGEPVLDSIWMDRYTLRTLRSVQRNRQGVTQIEYNRRSVRSLRVTPEGRRQQWRGLLDAEPYGLLGIEIVLGALPLRLGAGGSLPVVGGRADRLQWLHFEVVDHTLEPRQVAGGVLFQPVWLLQASLGNQLLHFWVDPEERAVVRRNLPGPDNTRMVVARGPKVPRVNAFPVEPLARDRPSRVIRQGGTNNPVAASPEG